MAKLSVGQVAPGFRLKDLEGKEVGLKDFRGQVALINFWSAECPWAERADAVLAGWQERVALLPVAANANEPPELLRTAAAARGLRVVLVDEEHRVADAYGAETTPHLFLVDAQGILRYQGAFDDTSFRQREPTRNYIEEALQDLLEGRPITVEETPAYGCTIVRFK